MKSTTNGHEGTNTIDLLLFAIAGTLNSFFVRPNIDKILENQRVIEIDQIYFDLHRLRDWEHNRIQRPDQVSYIIGERELRIHVTHGRKTETAFGIDLIYEIVGEKYVVIQYKRIGALIDKAQMEKMRKQFCPPWQHMACKIKETMPERNFRLGTLCTPYYKFVEGSPFAGNYAPLCFVRAKMHELGIQYAKPALMDQSISTDTFEELFVNCLIGSRWTYESKDVSLNELNRLYDDSPKFAYIAREGIVEDQQERNEY